MISKASLNFSSEVYQKQYETNKYDQFFNNTLSFNSSEKYEENGLVKKLNLSLINPNERSITGSDNKSETSNRLLSQLKYNLSYPLKKQSEIYDNIFKPTFLTDLVQIKQKTYPQLIEFLIFQT